MPLAKKMTMQFISTGVALVLSTLSLLVGHEGLQVNNVATLCSNGSACQNISNFGAIVSQLQNKAAINVSEATVTVFQSFALAEVVVLDDPSLESMLVNFVGVSKDIVITCIQNELLNSSRGFYFKKVASVTLTDLTIQNCSVFTKFDVSSISYNFSSGLYFEECSNITLHNIRVVWSLGSGVIILNNREILEVNNSTFDSNRLPAVLEKNFVGGSGMFLALKGVNNSHTLFQNCNFTNNYATDSKVIGRGGGIRISVTNSSSGNHIFINGSFFTGNEGGWGGGMYVFYEGDPQDNMINISYSKIEDNRSYLRSGGGLDLGIILSYDDPLNTFGDNFVHFEHCIFAGNSAKLYGGGTAIFASRLARSNPETHFIVFKDCEWRGNSALAGSAIDIAPSISESRIHGVLPRPLFQNCRFISNTLTTKFLNESENINISVTGEGTVLITGYTVQFEGNTTFSDNMGCGIYLSSGKVELLEKSDTTFLGNQGNNGGAIALGTFATIIMHDDTSLSFINNTAALSGGAIYSYSSDPHDHLSATNCFIERFRKEDASSSPSGILFHFEGNKALNSNGNDVYSTTVKQCNCKEYQGKPRYETFLCIGNLSGSLDNFDIATKVIQFSVDESVNQSVLGDIVPGSRFYKIPITACDEYGEVRETIYEVIQEDQENEVLPKSNQVAQNKLQFVGNLNVSSTLKLETDRTILSFNIVSSNKCPPGFNISDDEGDVDSKECQCAAENLFGLSHCENNKAYIIHGFWIGKCLDGKSICTSHCPLGFCIYTWEGKEKVSEVGGGVHELPSDYSELENFICGPTRKGVLCGSCGKNYSAYYHSYQYACGEKHQCYYGPLLYVVSELLPLTVMFFAIIIFDIRFTAGCVNGFIFYAQVLDSIAVDANGAITFPEALDYLTSIHRFVYRTFNFDFFSIEELSFCLWEDATTLDAMAMKYVTILYAIGLLVLLIIFMNTWKCKLLFSCWRPRTIQSSAKNGLTAFIVICYSQCARVSFQILSPGNLYGSDYKIRGQVAFRRGDYKSFGPEHLIYAIPAFLVLFVMSLIPFFLMVYPLVFKILAICNLNESKAATIISRLIPVPLLDSFQSSFKDNFRFFAGLYFLYRLLALAAYAYSNTLVIFYTWVELKLIVILALHSVIQPYKVKWHNIIDSLIFANLAIINGITLFNYFKVINASSKGGETEKNVIMFSVIQTVLIYVPIMCVVAYFGFWIFRKCRFRFGSKICSSLNKADMVPLPPLRDEEEINNLSKRQALLSEITYGM